MSTLHYEEKETIKYINLLASTPHFGIHIENDLPNLKL